MAYRVVVALVLAGALAGCQSRRPPAPAVSKVSSTLPPPVCADFSFPVYFGTSADRLSEAALQVVRDAALRVRGCALGRIDVVGLADAGGSAGGNLALSRRRAAAVATALAGAGLPRPVFDVDAVGDSGATTPAGDPEPLRRRTEVVIRAAPPPPAAAPRP